MCSHWLLCGLQTSDDAERSLLVKLKTECGYQFTSKLESMFTDIKTSRDTMLDYKSQETASTSSSSDLDLSVQVSPHRLTLFSREGGGGAFLKTGGGGDRWGAGLGFG